MQQFTPEEMTALTQAVVHHMDEWNISSEEMIAVLGLGEEVRPRNLQQYRMGMKAFPQTGETMNRIEHIVGIADALRTTFPFSSQMRVLWLRKPHRRFQRRAPLAVMLDEGAEGLMRVRIEVDCAYGYAINDALHAAQQQKIATA
ncbi:MAG: MbcA/ParS/Xre antitoxin family protein [Gammaproteobacteria bacterium]|nr:MbcA/ParS/Xre antitoxin family protein [Gammaproteobacteria bacterium]MBU1723889.1 MbcA/ParS/Xre antitoxin family protein [Gammaproteobacteria bacterium]MBU2006202.1 MbcA/ParS/Xre antitoxin family protein [Gammaproteobacteria bacterium]